MLKKTLSYILLIVGSIMVGISVGYILLPIKISTGGFSGLATIFYYLVGLPANAGLILINIPAFVVTFKVIGKDYGIKSFIGMLGCSLGITIGTFLGSLTSDFILASIFGGVLSGAGTALTYRAGGSTGGTDLIAKLVHHYRPYLNIGNILLAVDAVIIAILSFSFSSVEIALYSVVSVFVMTKTLNLILEGVDVQRALFVITNKPDEIADLIHEEIKKTATRLNAVGTYTNKETSILLCVVNNKDVPRVKELIKNTDEKSFTIVTNVSEAIGQGFSEA